MKNLKLKISFLALVMFVMHVNAHAFEPNAIYQKYPELCPYLNRTFGIGDSGNDVRRLQVVLGQEGIAYLNATGYFGPSTRSAVKVFQLRNGVRQTGAVGPLTLSRMLSSWCGQTQTVGTPAPLAPLPISGGNSFDSNNPNFEVNIAPVSSSGYSVTLDWSSRNAQTCSINNQTVPVYGRQIFTIYNETNFTITCTGYNGKQMSKTILVRPNIEPNSFPKVNVFVNPTSSIIGQTATIFWDSQNANYCTTSFISGNQQTSGNYSFVVPAGDQTYRVVCYGVNGLSAVGTINLSRGNLVGSIAPPTVINATTTPVTPTNNFVSISNSAVTANQNVSISWGYNCNLGSNPVMAGTCPLPEGVKIDLAHVTGLGEVGKGTIFFKTINNDTLQNVLNGTYNWVVPDRNKFENTFCPVDTPSLCGKNVVPGTYFLRAHFYTPANACFGFCPPNSSPNIIRSVDSPTFSIF